MPCTYASKFLLDTKTTDHIQITLDRILIEAGPDAENVQCTTNEGANMVAVMPHQCTYLHLSTSINIRLEITNVSLNECADGLVKFVKKLI